MSTAEDVTPRAGTELAAPPHDVGTPAVSVCVPLYRKAEFIGATIRSVLDQTFTDFELVVVDNASPDGSADVVRQFDDPRIVFSTSKATIPAGANFNRVVGRSRAPLVKVLAADDLVRPRCLERQVAALKDRPEAVMVTSRHDLIDDAGDVISPDRLLRTPDLVGPQDSITVIRRMIRHGGNPVGNPCNVLFRRWAYDAAGGFGDDEFFTLDVSLWSRILEHGSYVGLPETLAGFRISSDSYSHELGAEAVRIQRRFVRDLARRHPEAFGLRDRLYAAGRWPLTTLRHHLLFAAGGAPSDPRTRLASRIIAGGNAGRARR